MLGCGAGGAPEHDRRRRRPMGNQHRTIAPSGEASLTADGSILDRNLAALAIGSPGVARLVAQAQSPTDLEWTLADDGLLSCSVTDGWGRRVALASRKRPGDEAKRLAESVDLESAGALVVMGFALGHHVRELLVRAKSSALIVVYEPDVGLLRAVLERQDHSQWLKDPLLVFLTDPDDASQISAAFTGSEGLVSLGLQLVHHPPSAKRLGETIDRFEGNLAGVVRAIRTNIITTLMHSDITMRNELMNLDHYVESSGIVELAGCCQGRPAIVVSAGPSLKRNIHRLKEPGVRDRFVIIAVQTMLKPLLEMGIKPHFVTALDYHEISKRFYEGLTAEMVEGVTLVVEAKGNPAIMDAWPGAIRCPRDGCLSQLLEEPEAGRGSIAPGATVAHLAYYLARHMHADPVILIGQDLAFTDGQYYASGAAIHTVWSSELGPFNTLETMEWQRIARMRSRLIPARDHLGRAVYTDEQMHTYLTQFERDFAADVQRGLTIIDATEGGVDKAHTAVMPLAEALEQLRDGPSLNLPDPPDRRRGKAVREAVGRLRQVRGDVWKVAEICRKTEALMNEMAEHHSDQARVNRLIGEVEKQKQAIEKLEPAYSLVQDLNQTGTLRRAKADRLIHLGEESALDRQRAQIERDADNLRWLGDAADMLGDMMDSAIRAHDGKAAKITREDPPEDPEAEGANTKQSVWAMIPVDASVSDLGVARDLRRPALLGRTPLRLTLERLAQTTGLDGVALITAEPGEAAKAAGVDPSGGRVGRLTVRIIEVDENPMRERRSAVRGARAFATRSWRGGVAGWTAFDELLHPAATVQTMAKVGADAVVLVGADWSLIDPKLCDEAVRRFRANPRTHRLVFSQAAVGLGPCLIERSVIESIAEKLDEAGSFASIGTLLGYLPVQPSSDPIAGTGCILVDAAVRDLGARLTQDTPERFAMLETSLGGLGESLLTMSASEIAEHLGAHRPRLAEAGPEHLVLELVGVDGSQVETDLAISWIRQAASARPDLALTLTAERTTHDLAEVLDHPDLLKIIGAARGAGVLAIHVRTPALGSEEKLQTLLDIGVDVISLDYVSESADRCELLTGRQGFDAAHGAIARLVEARQSRPRLDGLGWPWLVARLTRRDAIYEELEPVYDRWLMTCGAAVIDPLPEPVAGERIEPIEMPMPALERLQGTELILTSAKLTHEGDHVRDGIIVAWRRRIETLNTAEPHQHAEAVASTAMGLA
ncbi:MAG TPA: DUF115 domain-containing protein [Phycisphaerales bacterium]|nr:DUF115 domain-containing protein [Phycisphaerales bacterium]